LIDFTTAVYIAVGAKTVAGAWALPLAGEAGCWICPTWDALDVFELCGLTIDPVKRQKDGKYGV